MFAVKTTNDSAMSLVEKKGRNREKSRGTKMFCRAQKRQSMCNGLGQMQPGSNTLIE